MEEDWERKLEDLRRETELLEAENDMLESYARRNPMPEDVESDNERGKERRKKQQKKQRIPTALTLEQKLDVAQSELHEVGRETDEMKQNSEKLIDTLRAVLEETDIKIAELKKEAYEFKRDIVVGAENFRTGKTMAEKVIRYMEETLRKKDSVIDKLRLKNATLKSQIAKVEGQLKQKEEMGDVLHYIDFHQLQIENKQYVSKIEERNTDLIKLKMTTGRTVQVLNSLKRRLHELTTEQEWLRSEIKSRTTLLGKNQAENGRVRAEIRSAEGTVDVLRTRAEDTAGMPQVLDYVKQKAEMYELQNALRNWERKVEIATMGAKRAKALQAAAELGQIPGHVQL